MTNEQAMRLLKNRLYCESKRYTYCGGRECSNCKYNWGQEEMEEAEELAIKALEERRLE